MPSSEYGIQDGSGFAYSTIYVVDLVADKWVAGSPFHTQAPEADGDRPLATVRADAMALARAKLDMLAIATPAETLWLDGTSAGDGKAISFSYGPFPSDENALSLTLTTAPADSSLDCAGLTGSKPLGFSLSFASGQAEAVVKHDDKSHVPASRGCTTDYRTLRRPPSLPGGRPLPDRGDHRQLSLGFEGRTGASSRCPIDPERSPQTRSSATRATSCCAAWAATASRR